MIGPDLELSLVEPQEIVRSEILKTLREFADVLGIPSKQAATVTHDPGTIDKVLNMEFTAMLMSTGFDNATEFLRSVKSIIHGVLVTIKEKGDDNSVLANAITFFNNEDNSNALY